MNTLAYLRGHRIWFIPGFIVWGSSSGAEISFITVNTVASQKQLSYTETSIGGTRQTVSFDALIDHRGNNLPTNLKSPKVIPLSKGDERIFVVGREFNSGFSISRDSSGTTSVATDLLIVELD